MVYAEASMDSSEETNRTLEGYTEVMSSVRYIYTTDIRDLEKLHKADCREELEESADIELCDPP